MTTTRRDAIKYMLGTSLGLAVGAGATKAVGATLEGAINISYDATYETLAAVLGTAKNRVQQEVGKVRDYVGTTVAEEQKRQEYWTQVGLLSKKESTDLNRILARAEEYANSRTLTERLTQLKDRAHSRLAKADSALQKNQPKGLRSIAEKFTKLIKGKEEGSRAALEAYTTRVNSLVQVYNTNRDNLLAQAGLLAETGDNFSKAQEEVLQTVDGYLQSGKITDTNEKAFFTELQKLGKNDPTGRKLADHMFGTSYFTTKQTSTVMGELHEQVSQTIDSLKRVQGTMDEGLQLRRELRSTRKTEIGRLQDLHTKTTKLYDQMEEEKRTLAAEGHEINYDMYPGLTKAKNAALKSMSGLSKIVGSVAGVAAGLGTVWGLGKIPYLSNTVNRKKLDKAEARIKELEKPSK